MNNNYSGSSKTKTITFTEFLARPPLPESCLAGGLARLGVRWASSEESVPVEVPTASVFLGRPRRFGIGPVVGSSRGIPIFIRSPESPIRVLYNCGPGSAVSPIRGQISDDNRIIDGFGLEQYPV